MSHCGIDNFEHLIKHFEMRCFFIFMILVVQNARAVEHKVSLQEKDWVSVSYNKIAPNKTTFSNGLLTIEVNRSASPLAQRLEKPIKVRGFKIEGSIVGLKKSETTDFDEDSVLRMGLVAVGKNTLTGVKKWIAANWVKQLFTLAPEGLGLDRIYFFNITDRQALLGKERTHPASQLISEKISYLHQGEGQYFFSQVLPVAIETAAIWLSVDGDQSGSVFKNTISQMTLTE